MNETCYERLLKQSQIPPGRLADIPLTPPDCDYDTFVYLQEIRENVVNWVNEGHNIYLCSKETGNGKTTWGIKILKEYLACMSDYSPLRPIGMFVNVPVYLNQIKRMMSTDQAELYRLQHDIDNARLVIWDDIVPGTTLTAFEHSTMLAHISYRDMQNSSNIFTANVEGKVLEECLGSKMASRIWNSSEVIRFRGSDRRVK